LRVGVVGGGPSAFGALARLVTLKKHGHEIEIDLFSVGDPEQEKFIAANYKQVYSNKDVNLIIKTLKQEKSGGLLPPRSFNLKTMQEYDGVNITSGIKRSETFGGLGNYWSSSVFPMNRIFDPLYERLGDIEEHYKFLSELIPISGVRGDGMKTFFDDQHINMSSIDVASGLKKLKSDEGVEKKERFEILVGTNRFAVNTNSDDRDGCIHCGDCLYGCPRDAIFRAGKAIQKIASEGECNIKFEKVLTVRTSNRQVQLITDRGESIYDRIFLCAGAPNTIEIVGKSFGEPTRRITIYDNLLWYFPVFSFFPKKTRFLESSFAFAELAGGIFDHANLSYNHLLISSLPSAIVENFIYRNPISRVSTKLISNHLIVGAMYGSPEEYIKYHVKYYDGNMRLGEVEKSVDGMNKEKFDFLKKYLSDRGWYTHRMLAFQHDTSGHYTGNLGEAYDVEDLPKTGRFRDNIYICDSSSWNMASMSQQHTFTIMAYASKIVQNAFN
jgi:ferredoxin